jgi:signal peptide peptidase-like 3
VGLVLTLSVGILSRAPQPALMYLVPCALAPVLARASMQGELSELWHGPRPLLVNMDEKVPEV